MNPGRGLVVQKKRGDAGRRQGLMTMRYWPMRRIQDAIACPCESVGISRGKLRLVERVHSVGSRYLVNGRRLLPRLWEIVDNCQYGRCVVWVIVGNRGQSLREIVEFFRDYVWQG